MPENTIQEIRFKVGEIDQIQPIDSNLSAATWPTMAEQSERAEATMTEPERDDQAEEQPAAGGDSGRRVASENSVIPADAEYRAEDLQHLSDLEHVRERPSMYIGDTTARGLHHLVYEVVDNSIDEAMADFAKQVSVTINNDGSVTVEDDGRGIPVERHEQLSRGTGPRSSTLEGVMTVLKFGGKFEKGAYQTSGGLHGVGVTVVNFLSEWCEVEVFRDGHVYQQEYERGIPGRARSDALDRPRRSAPRPPLNPTRRSFKPRSFSTTRLQTTARIGFLNRGVHIVYRDERNDEGEEFYYERGIIEFVEHLNRASEATPR